MVSNGVIFKWKQDTAERELQGHDVIGEEYPLLIQPFVDINLTLFNMKIIETASK